MNSAAQDRDVLGQPTLGPESGDDRERPLTRRELRARERAELTGPDGTGPDARSRPVALAGPDARSGPHALSGPRAHTYRLPPLLATTPQRANTRPANRWLAKGFSLLAMTFAVALAVATSVPANALLTKSEVQANALAAQGSRVEPAELQELASGSTMAAPIARDGVDVTSAEQVVALSHMRIANTFTNDPHGTIQWPFPVGVPITDGFGPRIAPTDGASTFHQGVDFAPGEGTPIQIIANGVVRQVVAKNDNSCGVHVTIDHLINGQLVSSKYCHMRLGSVRVTEGQQVKVADIVGLVGNTGVSTGAHLHFEILLGGTEPVDPFAWLKANAN